jgi:hypothetical protein
MLSLLIVDIGRWTPRKNLFECAIAAEVDHIPRQVLRAVKHIGTTFKVVL